MDGSIDVRIQPLLFYEAIMGQFPQWDVLLRVVKDRSVSRCLWINLGTLISQEVRPAITAGPGKAHQWGGLQVPSALISPPISLKLKQQMGNWFLAPCPWQYLLLSLGHQVGLHFPKLLFKMFIIDTKGLVGRKPRQPWRGWREEELSELLAFLWQQVLHATILKTSWVERTTLTSLL